MPDNKENKRLAKNTFFLYLRMILTMLVGLYTSRIILQVLGFSDFGLFNVVGGMVTFFSFVNTALTGGTSRFLTIAIGNNISSQTERTFRVALTLHVIVALIFFVIMECIGLFLLRFVLNVPEYRETAAFWVFQFTTIAVCFDFIRILMDADIVAHERMNYYAYISIFEVTLKLAIVYMLIWFNSGDKLIFYGFLYLLTTILVTGVSSFYCKRHFEECKMFFLFDKKLFNEIGSYTGWNILSHISYMISSQGINIILNVFQGTIVNAARGLSVQINSALTKFTNSYSMALGPQIIKQYAAGNIDEMFILSKNSSKYSSYLYCVVAIPLFIEIDNVLHLWLSNIPEHTAVFCRVMIVQGLIVAFCNSMQRVIGATGKIKNVNIVDLCLHFFTFLLLLTFLWIGIDVDVAIILILLPNVLGIINYMYHIKKYVGIRVLEYLTEVVPKVILVFSCSILIPIVIHFKMSDGLFRLAIVVIINLICFAFSVLTIGIDKSTRQLIILIFKNKIHQYF